MSSKRRTDSTPKSAANEEEEPLMDAETVKLLKQFLRQMHVTAPLPDMRIHDLRLSWNVTVTAADDTVVASSAGCSDLPGVLASPSVLEAVASIQADIDSKVSKSVAGQLQGWINEMMVEEERRARVGIVPSIEVGYSGSNPTLESHASS